MRAGHSRVEERLIPFDALSPLEACSMVFRLAFPEPIQRCSKRLARHFGIDDFAKEVL